MYHHRAYFPIVDQSYLKGESMYPSTILISSSLRLAQYIYPGSVAWSHNHNPSQFSVLVIWEFQHKALETIVYPDMIEKTKGSLGEIMLHYPVRRPFPCEKRSKSPHFALPHVFGKIWYLPIDDTRCEQRHTYYTRVDSSRLRHPGKFASRYFASTNVWMGLLISGLELNSYCAARISSSCNRCF